MLSALARQKLICTDIWKGFFAKVSVWQGFRRGLRPPFSSCSCFEGSPRKASKEESFAEHTE